MILFLLHLCLAIILFLLTNWLGKYSENLGYNKIDFIIDKEDSIAFNFSFKILTSVFFIIIVSSIFYVVKMDKYTKDIYLVVYYSVLIRFLFNLIMERYHIVNKKIYILNSLCICFFSYLAYKYIIEPKKPMIPDFNTLSNELWIIILLFVYNTINKVEIPKSLKEKKLKEYVIIKYKNIEQKYENIIDDSLSQFINGDNFLNFIYSKNIDYGDVFVEKIESF